MRVLACSIALTTIVPLAVGCPSDPAEDDATTVMPSSTQGSGSGSETASPGTTDEPDTTSVPPSTTGVTTTDDGPADSSSDDGSETTAAGMPGDWLLTVDNGSSPPRLVRVGLAGGTVEVCTLAPTVSYSSLVFARDGTLYGHNAAANRLDTINPCNCSFQLVGPTSLGPITLGLGPATSDVLLGLDATLDALVRVDPSTGLGTVVGPLDFMFGVGSLAWSDTIASPYAIEGDNDFLYTVSVTTGESTPLQMVTEDVTNPGLAVHPNDGGLYVCSGDTMYSLDPVTGLMLPIGGLGLSGGCQTLAAPQTAVACVDAL